jgi:hypothetical protein
VARRNPRRLPRRPRPDRTTSGRELHTTADHLQRTLDRRARIVALDEDDRHAILRALEDCPTALLEFPRNARPGSVLEAGRRAVRERRVPRPSRESLLESHITLTLYHVQGIKLKCGK